MVSMRSSILSRLCAWRDLVALARKRSTNDVICATRRICRACSAFAGQLLGALLLELRIVARVGADAAILDVQHAADDRVEKFPVVRNHQQRAR
jgi:hypothetical protein